MKTIVLASDAAEGDLLRQVSVYAGVEAEAHGEMQVAAALSALGVVL
jgi:hypothetical protein